MNVKKITLFICFLTLLYPSKYAFSENFEILKFLGDVQVSPDNKNWKKVDTPQKLKMDFGLKQEEMPKSHYFYLTGLKL